jgi:hypothetical protein
MYERLLAACPDQVRQLIGSAAVTAIRTIKRRIPRS